MSFQSKIRSKTVHISNKQQQLSLYAAEIMRRQQIAMLDDLKRLQLRKQKVKKVQTDFQSQLEAKHKSLHQKMQHSQARRTKNLYEKVKKCQNYEKSLAQKQKAYKRKTKQSMKSAWNEAQKFNSQTLTYFRSKHSNEKSLKTPFLHSRKRKGSQAQSVQIKGDNKILQQQTNQNVSKVSNFRHLQQSAYPNSSNNFKQASKYQRFVNTSLLFNQQAKQQRISPSPFKDLSSDKNKINFKQPIKNQLSELQRMHQISKNQQNEKIKNLMKKLQNIELKRKKRMQNFAKRKQHNRHEQSRVKNEYNYTQSRDQQKQNKKRINSEHGDLNSSKRKGVTDWSMHNRLKRQQLEQEKFNNGNQYLQDIRFKRMKYVLEKNALDSTIQRRLYMKNVKKAAIQ